MGVFRPNTMVPEGWTLKDWMDAIREVAEGEREPTERELTAGIMPRDCYGTGYAWHKGKKRK